MPVRRLGSGHRPPESFSRQSRANVGVSDNISFVVQIDELTIEDLPVGRKGRDAKERGQEDVGAVQGRCRAVGRLHWSEAAVFGLPLSVNFKAAEFMQ